MIADLFAGPGGWDVGAHWLGLDVRGIELDDDACATRYAAGLKSIQEDVRNIDVADLRGVTAIIASPPCPDFSRAGKHKGIDGETGSLIYEVPRLITGVAPQWFACEQVPGVLPYWEEFAREFNDLGYFTWTGVLDAADYRVPQNRKRAFLLGRTVRPIVMPTPGEHRSVAEALGWERSTLFGFPRRADAGRPSIDIDGVAYRARDLRTADKPAFTLTEKARSWSVWDASGRRALTVSEAARLQTFPHDYPFHGSRTSVFHQIGNAVPPELAYQVLKAIVQ